MSLNSSKKLTSSPTKDSVALSDDKELVYMPTYRRCAAGCRRFFVSDRSTGSLSKSRTNASPVRLGLKAKKIERCPYCNSAASPERGGGKGEKSVRDGSPHMKDSQTKWGVDGKMHSLGGLDYSKAGGLSRTTKPLTLGADRDDTTGYESSPDYFRTRTKPSSSYDLRQKDTGEMTTYDSSPEYYKSNLKPRGSPSFADNEFRASSGDLGGVKPKHTVQFENSPSLNPLMKSGSSSAYRSGDYASPIGKSNLLGSQSSYASTGLKSSELRTVSATSNGSKYLSSSRPSSISDYPSPMRGSQETGSMFNTPYKQCKSTCGRHRGHFASCLEFFESRMREGKDIGPRFV